LPAQCDISHQEEFFADCNKNAKNLMTMLNQWASFSSQNRQEV